MAPVAVAVPKHAPPSVLPTPPAATAPATAPASAPSGALPAQVSREQLLDVLWTLPPAQMATVLAALTANGAAPPAAAASPAPQPATTVEIREKLATIDLEDDDLEDLEQIRPPRPVILAPPVMPAPRPAPVPITSVAPVTPVTSIAPVAAIPPPVASFEPPVAAPVVEPVVEHVVEQAPAARISVLDPMDLLFDAMYELNFFETSVEGASYCLASLLRALPSRAGLVHLLDPETRELVTVYAQGANAEHLVLGRISDDDWLVSAAICKHRPLIMNYDGDVSSRPLERHAFFGEPRSVIVAPVITWGRCLAVIELVDPADGSVFDVRAENALAYVCDRYAEFVGEHGVDISNVVAPPSAVINV